MKHVMPIRKALGVRTIFNLLGPLANPLEPEIQLLGVSHKKYLVPMAETLAKLGIHKAYVVHSRDGMDEISPCAKTDGLWIENATVLERNFDPSSLALRAKPEELVGGDVTDWKFDSDRV